MSTRANEGRRLDLRLPKHDNYCVKSPLAADSIHVEFDNMTVWTITTFVNQDTNSTEISRDVANKHNPHIMTMHVVAR